MADTAISATGPQSLSEARRVATASAIGTTIEYYDFFIYGTAASVVFAPQFFPQASELAGRLAALLTFAVGFVARPLGAVVMGHFGDRWGRKSMFVWSLMLMGLSTVGIGLLPGYAEIGLWAPLFLVILRLGQGFALGGEWGGAVLMSVEHAPQEQRGLFGGVVALGIPAGIILSNLMFLVMSASVTPEAFTAWGWRVPFVASAGLILVGLFVRTRVSESPIFAGIHGFQARRRAPVIEVIRRHRREVGLAAGSYLAVSAQGYLVLVYFISYATRQLGLPLTTALALVMLAAVVIAGSIALSAIWSDRMSRRRLMTVSLAGLSLWSLILFPLVDTRSVPLIGLALVGMALLHGPYLATQPAVFAELFPTAVRYSGVSLSLTLGTVLGGALAPTIATALFSLRGDSWPVTTYLAALSLVSWLCGRRLAETRHVDLSDLDPSLPRETAAPSSGARGCAGRTIR
jgi:MFS family permease